MKTSKINLFSFVVLSVFIISSCAATTEYTRTTTDTFGVIGTDGPENEETGSKEVTNTNENNFVTNKSYAVLDTLVVNFPADEVHYGPDIWNGIIGGIVTFLALWATWRFEKNKDQQKKEEDELERVQFLMANLDKVIHNAEIFIKNSKEFIKKIDDNSLEIPPFENVSPISFRRLSKIVAVDQNYHAFIAFYGNTKDTRKYYGNIIAMADYFEVFHENNKGDFYKKDHERKKIFQSLFEKLLSMPAQIDNNVRSSNPTMANEFYNILAEYKDKITKDDKYDLKRHFELYIDPIAKIVEKYLPQRPVLETSVLIRQIFVVYHDIPIQNKLLATEFSTLLIEYEASLNKLKDNLLSLEKMRKY